MTPRKRASKRLTQNPFLHAKREAQEIIERFHISAADQIDLSAIAGFHDIYCIEAKLEGADARLQLINNTGMITLRADIPEVGRKRFAVAHEIGHFVLHRAHQHIRACSEVEFLQWYDKCTEEPEANVFASELIMPETLFARQCRGMKPGFGAVAELATIFGTSITSTAYRYVEVGNYPCALVATKDSIISWFTASRDFRYRLRKCGSLVAKDSCAGDYFCLGHRPPEKPEPVLATLWLENSFPEITRVELYEHAIAMPTYKTVLSMLWYK